MGSNSVACHKNASINDNKHVNSLSRVSSLAVSKPVAAKLSRVLLTVQLLQFYLLVKCFFILFLREAAAPVTT